MKFRRFVDGKVFAMKQIRDAEEVDLKKALKGANLLAHLASDEFIKCVDFYNYNNQIFMMFEMMDQSGCLMDLIRLDNRNSEYSEDFYRYTLYKVANALQTMHSRNVLHRAIKSENVIYSASTGQIKLA